MDNTDIKSPYMASLLQELKEFENFTLEAPTDKHAIHVKHVINTADSQKLMRSLELLRTTPEESIFWVLDDYSVALGRVDS